jgi:hypothetical protein
MEVALKIRENAREFSVDGMHLSNYKHNVGFRTSALGF